MTSVHSWWFIFINLEKQDGPSFLTFKRNAVLFIFGFAGSLLLLMGFLLVVVSGGYSSLRCMGLSLQWLLLLWSIGTWASIVAAHGLTGCSWQALERGLSGCGTCALAPLRHVTSSRTRD